MTLVRTADVPPLQVLSDQLRLLLRSHQSPHRMNAMVVEVPPGGGVPPHRHRQEEGYFVLEGRLQLQIGEQSHDLGPGGFGHVLPGTVHGYANRSDRPVRFLAWTVGGPIDRFFEQMSQRVRRMPDDAPAMAELAAAFGIEMVGDPPQP